MSLHEQCFMTPLKSAKEQTAQDSFCYKSQAAKVAKDLDANPGQRAALCWPPAKKPGAKRAASAIYEVPPHQCSWSIPVFHTIDNGDGNLPNLVASFLATQCCSSQLWVWVNGSPDPQNVLAGLSVPQQHVGRVQVFRPAKGDKLAPLDIIYKHGGTYVSGDTVLLRDFSPLFATNKAFFQRWSCTDQIFPHVMHMPCGSPIASNDFLHIYDSNRVSPGGLFATLKGMADIPAHDAMFTLISSTMLDPVWMRQDGCEPESMQRANAGVRSFDDVFRAGRDPLLVSPTPALLFFSGAFAANMHGRSEPAEGSWGLELARRNRQMAKDKMC